MKKMELEFVFRETDIERARAYHILNQCRRKGIPPDESAEIRCVGDPLGSDLWLAGGLLKMISW